MAGSLPSTSMKKKLPIRSTSLPTTSIAPFCVLLQCFQVVGYKLIFFPSLNRLRLISISLQSLPHTRNPCSEHCTKLLTTESSQASPHACPCNLASSSLSVTLFQAFNSSLLLYASLGPTGHLPDTNPTEGKPSSCSLPQNGHCLCPKALILGVSSGHELAQDRWWLGAQLASEMSWHTACFPRTYRFKW